MSKRAVSAWMSKLARTRLDALTPEQRKELARKAALARWAKAKGAK